MGTDNETSGPGRPEPGPALTEVQRIRSLLLGLFIIANVYALYIGRDFFMPVMLAFLLAMTLTPIVRFLRKQGVPEPLSATLLVLLSMLAIFSAGYIMSGPATDLVNNAPEIGRKLAQRLSELKHPFDRFMEISKQIDRVAGTSQDAGVQKVVVAQSGFISQAAGNLLTGATTVAITFVLSLFLLASGTMFYEKIVQSFGRLSDKKRALRIVYDVEREISHYLLTIALINGGLGLAVAGGMWLIGMPNPPVWGVAAALLNFLPYIGALMTITLVAVISMITFDSFSYALLAPGFVIMCNIIEGQFVTPLVVGRRLEVNTVAVFIAVAFWSWLWGFVGALIAVPLLVVVKVFCDHFDSLKNVGNFLAAQQATEPAQEETPAAT